MHHLRDALLRTSPKGPPELTMLDSQALDQQDVRECVARGELEELRGAAFYNRTSIVTERYCALGDGVDSLEGHLHSLWHMYYQLGRHTSHETAGQDRLVLDVVRIQGLGPLTRPAAGNYGIDIARTVEGTLWNDLPFLATDMTGFWIESCATVSGAQRLNLASFLAKLASARVGRDRMSQIALVLFRSMFEERRDLCIPDQADDAENTRRSISSLDIAQLLPSVCVWIKEAGHQLIFLSDVYWNDCPSMIGGGGQMFTESELGKRSPTGFTPWRWMYWLKRLHEIKEEAEKANQTHLEELATEAIDFMASNAKERNSGIIKAYKSGGDVLRNDKRLSCLEGDDAE
ncbi:hypothetical protein PG993_013425 [Apiospora rasikravindrae]|uniref:Uncharacterized protein n=1 Tax=Apiospora rasikravindrae TaxID=990691 RepID=A0ABR1RY40_9PEZI